MTEWNESTLRTAASWKAFKDGKSLFESGAVSAAKKGSAMWTGAVRDGKRVYKVAVKVLSATNLEARCACPDNQTTGALCAHAVAAGLATLGQEAIKAPGATPTAIEAPKQSPPSVGRKAPPPVVAWSIGLPVNWQSSVRSGKLAVALQAGGDVTVADERISLWLQDAGVKPVQVIQLSLDGVLCESFLHAAAGHPRVVVRKTDTSISLQEPAVYAIASLERSKEMVRLRSAGDLVKVGNGWFRISDSEVVPIGPVNPPGWLKRMLSELGTSRYLELPLREFLLYLERLQEWIELPSEPWLDAIHFAPAEHQVEMAIDGSAARIEASVRIHYGDSPPVPLGMGEVEGLPHLEGNRCAVRDWEGERAIAENLKKAGFESKDLNVFSIEGDPAVAQFVARHLPLLEKKWQIVGSPRFNDVRRRVMIITPKIKVIGEGDDWLRFDLSFQSNDGHLFDQGEIRQLLRGGSGNNGKRAFVSEDASNILESLWEDLDLRQEDGGYVASKLTGEVIRKLCKKIQNDPNISDINKNLDTDFPDIAVALRPYQTIGAGWLLDRVSNYGGALLADDMGLGKTIQSIACITRLKQSEEGQVLVVATTSLLGNWRAEFAKFAPHLRVRMLHGPGREKEQDLAGEGDVLLTTYGTLPRDLAWYLKRKFRAIVVDEASLMRNPDTDHAKAISRLRADAKIALTGTPIENGVRDLWSIFRFIQPGWLGSREDFKQKYESLADDAKVIERLHLKTSPFLLRRTKAEVAPELPSKIVIEEYCDLTADQQAVYRELLNEGRKRVEEMEDSKNSGAARMRMLTALLRLRQASCDLALFENEKFKRLSVVRRSAKLQRLLELVSEAISGNHKILIFSQFQKQLREIENSLNEAGIRSIRLDGQTRNRQELVDAFQSSQGPPVFLISLKAGGYGLNLTAADTVIHFDPWWNPAAEAQATDRAHRIGQTRPVTVYKLIARGTVEEKVLGLQEKKRKIAVAIDEAGGGEAAGWSESELMDLLRE